MAEETIDKAIKEGFLKKTKCVTSDLKFTVLACDNITERLNIYGDQSVNIKKMISEDPGLGMPVDSRLPYTRAEILWICRNEMPLSIEDILARRTRSLFLNAKASGEMASDVADMMADEFGYDQKWKSDQVDSYNALAKNYL